MTHSKNLIREDAQPVASAYRVRPEMNDPEEWTLMHPERAFDYLDRPGWETQPLYTHPAPDALREFGEHRNLELSYHYADEDDDGAWQIHRVNGGRNDREWTLIGSGATPADAIDQALATLQAEQKGGAA